MRVYKQTSTLWLAGTLAIAALPMFASAQGPVIPQTAVPQTTIPQTRIPQASGLQPATPQPQNSQQQNSQPQNVQPEAAAHPLAGAIQMAEQARDVARQMKDYRAIFSKREIVAGTVFASQIDLKFRSDPFSVYLKFINPDHAGREVLYVEGQNGNQMLAHDVGVRALFGTVALDPNGTTALAEARYPVTRVGIANLAEGVALQWKEELAYGECDVKYYPEAKLGEQQVIVIESSHPTPRRQFRFAMTRLWLDKQTRLPVRLQQYEFNRVPGGQPILAEEYTYTNVQPNVGLTDADFNPRNPNYSF